MAIQVSGSTVIHDSQDVQVSGMFTASSFVGDASQLTNLPASGGTLEATASGTLADGSKVIVNADGTVSTIVQTGISAWIAVLGTGLTDYGKDIAIDSSGNVYVTGYTQTSGAGSNDFFIAKYSASGTIQWQRTLGASSNDAASGIAVDGSGNVYVTGTTFSPDTVLIAKYDTSGNIQWQKTLGGAGDHGTYDIAVDSSGNAYVTGKYYNGGSDSGILLAKYDSSGNLQWQKRTSGGTEDRGHSIKLDSSGNIYIVGQTRTVATYHDILVMKLDSSGSVIWDRAITSASNQGDEGWGVAIDSSGNVYVTGKISGSSGTELFVGKYNSSGTEQWQRSYNGGYGQGRGIAVDGSGNVYVTGFGGWSSGKSYDIMIVKYNSSGAIQWERTLGDVGNTVYESAENLVVDGSGNLYIVGWQQSAGDGAYIIKLPGDGSLTGSYSTPGYTLAYASLSGTSTNSSYSTNARSITTSTINLTDSASSFTDAASNLPASTTTISSLSTTLTSENFIGISNGAYSDGQTATIQVTGSVDDAQSGLTAGQAYYVQDDGTLGESGSVFAGTAVSASKIIVKG